MFETRSILGLENTENIDKERMLAFLTARGGRVPFDEYMQENLYGKNGYFSKTAEIGKLDEGGHFTTNALKKEFAFLLSAYLQSRGVSNKDFLELAGGNAVFKDNLLTLAPGTNYLSVDISPKFAAAQKKAGEGTNGENFDTVIGSAYALPFADKSINGAIFANEILDNLPARVFKVSVGMAGGLSISKEVFVEKSTKNKIVSVFDNPMEDDFFREYQEFLRSVQGERNMGNGDTISVSPHHRKLIQELGRVLNRGMILLFDYGFTNANDRNAESDPYFINTTMPNRFSRIRRDFLDQPYKTDITYMVDFPYCEFLMKKILKDAKVVSEVEMDFFSKILNSYPALKETGGSSELDFSKVTNGSGFRVLRAEK